MGCSASKGSTAHNGHTRGSPESDDDGDVVVASFQEADVVAFDQAHKERSRAEESRRREDENRRAAELARRENEEQRAHEQQLKVWSEFEDDQKRERQQIAEEARRHESRDASADVLTL